MHAIISITIQVLLLAYTNQACILNLKLAMQHFICLCTYKCNNLFMSLLPLLCSQNLNNDPLPLPFLSLCHTFLNISYLCNLFHPLCQQSPKQCQILVGVKSINEVNVRIILSLWFNLDQLPRVCN
jgi:hypothetical protein